MTWTWILTALSVFGVILNIKKNRWGFACWMVTNAGWMIVDFRAGIYSQSAMFAIYFCLASWGMAEWKK
jgi:nicotinamide riboside transporter PnuC